MLRQFRGHPKVPVPFGTGLPKKFPYGPDHVAPGVAQPTQGVAGPSFEAPAQPQDNAPESPDFQRGGFPSPNGGYSSGSREFPGFRSIEPRQAPHGVLSPQAHGTDVPSLHYSPSGFRNEHEHHGPPFSGRPSRPSFAGDFSGPHRFPKQRRQFRGGAGSPDHAPPFPVSTGAPSAPASSNGGNSQQQGPPSPASFSDSNNGQHFGALAHPGADSFAHGRQGMPVEIPHGSSFGGFQQKARREQTEQDLAELEAALEAVNEITKSLTAQVQRRA
ncbi:hypothetical protein LTS18_006256 [Coniosporium uncinatum]|uniref:Uncharacterized protein n=1 Tax=Coniosporium uncinatum TaxID=93489 RepID=A0ACC3DB91_9PEZI|nr:hypothetical protein LTS18_006256 [Coniosporium uncinatum]